ncbi:MAG: hypothetical protein LPK45_10490, partial [Bacteroidota bacterium]|nr:hypothetical protein [Bacteroidota bacterium]MDX5431526.1 hypothetical protein [Bacteroidota bacterium]MDX5470247.1 hypothetical protein [Bacteroidota bacterium]
MKKTLPIEIYKELVEARKACTLCRGDLINPSSIPHLDSDEIGPLSLWQSSLEADVLVVAQDWGNVDYFRTNQGRDDANEITSRNLEEFLKIAGLDPGAVLEKKKN